jgi:hypothetical protein
VSAESLQLHRKVRFPDLLEPETIFDDSDVDGEIYEVEQIMHREIRIRWKGFSPADGGR